MDLWDTYNGQAKSERWIVELPDGTIRKFSVSQAQECVNLICDLTFNKNPNLIPIDDERVNRVYGEAIAQRDANRKQ